MRFLCLAAAAIFSLFTYWQFNDLEQYGTGLWYAWALTYGAVALVSLVSALRTLPRPLLLAGSALAAAVSLVRMTAIDWSGEIFNDETNPAGNESGGLIIVALWLVFLAAKHARVAETSRRTDSDL
jgi:hypothetical protein